MKISCKHKRSLSHVRLSYNCGMKLRILPINHKVAAVGLSFMSSSNASNEGIGASYVE